MVVGVVSGPQRRKLALDTSVLAGLLIDFERNRSSFDVRLNEVLRATGTKLAEVALSALAKDRFPPAVDMPAAARRGTA